MKKRAQGEDVNRGVPSRGVQGATVLHRLARLYEMAIQGATKGATKCNIGCYIFAELQGKAGSSLPLNSTKTSEKPRNPVNLA